MYKLCLVLFSAVLFVACTPTYTKYIELYQNYEKPEQPDYGDLYYWAAHPAIWDPSDSVPKPIRKDYRFDSTADVFFIHPTTFTEGEAKNWSASFSDAGLNAKTDYSPVLFQASVFNQYRVFAPRYRQAHLRSYFPGPHDTAQALAAFEQAYQDVKAAFEYYLKTDNCGRPIIIASHSQGSTHAIRLLKEFFDGKPLQQQLVAAYVIGMYMPDNSFSSLPICTKPGQTGCVIGWRTYKMDYTPAFVKKETQPSIVVNPLTWTTDTGFVDRKQNNSSILLNFNHIRGSVADAQIHDGLLWTRHPHFPGSRFYKTSNYHIGDINLYYGSIRENVALRVHCMGTSK